MATRRKLTCAAGVGLALLVAFWWMPTEESRPHRAAWELRTPDQTMAAGQRRRMRHEALNLMRERLGHRAATKWLADNGHREDDAFREIGMFNQNGDFTPDVFDAARRADAVSP